MKTSEIILCASCKGTGKKSYETCVDYHKREYETVYETCIYCDGKGRLRQVTKVTLEKLKDD